jgi:hypothetical protein
MNGNLFFVLLLYSLVYLFQKKSHQNFVLQVHQLSVFFQKKPHILIHQKQKLNHLKYVNKTFFIKSFQK